jgi:hypothetical protein
VLFGHHLYELEVGHITTLDFLVVLARIIRYMPQLDIQDREKDNPHRAETENPWLSPIISTVYVKSHF